MREEEIPQDDSALKNITKEVCYVKDKNGKYNTALSSGWDVKSVALENAWADVTEEIQQAKELVLKGDKSPIYYYMHKHMMDLSLLSSYMKISRLRVYLHLTPFAYKRLSKDILSRYADVFKVAVEDLDKLL